MPSNSSGSRGVPTWVLVLAGLVFAGGIVSAVFRAQALPRGPEPIAWDQETCAHCKMAISERGFASQLQLPDGQVHSFDDPGCLFEYWRKKGSPGPHAIYFHHHQEDRWLRMGQVAFVKVTPTPMGFGLGAVDRGAPGSISFEEAAKGASK